MAESEYEVTDEDAESEFQEIKNKEANEKSMIRAYKENKKDEDEENKKERAKNKDAVIIEPDKYQKR
jgi:hypothetical protein